MTESKMKAVLERMVRNRTPSDNKKANVVLFGIYYSKQIESEGWTKNYCIEFAKEACAKHGTELHDAAKHWSEHVTLTDETIEAIKAVRHEVEQEAA